MDKILTLGIETSCDETAGNVTLHPMSAIEPLINSANRRD